VLCGATASAGHVAQGTVNNGAMRLAEQGQELNELDDQRVREKIVDLLFAYAAFIANELREIDVQGICQALERAECGDGLAVLNLRDVGARHLHTICKLTLAQMAHATQIAHLCCHLQTGLL
jgi:hypothetical protein